ncbi:MAG TPA: hypothetical protein VKI40_00360 [Terriglobales bacterium]|nr:hypothetical protein [Terriglobales bacterium]
MRVTGPERYRLTFNANDFEVTCKNGTPRFSGIANSKKPKLYIASIDEAPIYVGVTKQPIRNRLRLGWSAKGETGYYGYAWRRGLTEANLDIWCHEDAPVDNPTLDVETVEAEVVFLIRCAGQWPPYQTEIHFHPSSAVHRDLAASIIQRYVGLPFLAPPSHKG